MTDRRLEVGVLDVYGDEIRELIARGVPNTWSVRVATSYDRDEQLRVAAGAEMLLTGWAPVDAELMAAAPELILIHKLGVGVDKIDLVEAGRRGVAVAITAGANAVAVAEMTVLLTLVVLRNFVWSVEELRQGRFRKSEMRAISYQLSGRRVGLIGLGQIGREATRRFRSFGNEVVYYDIARADERCERELGVRYMAMKELLGQVDVVSLHVPLTSATRHILDRDAMALMKPGSVVINTSRGGLIEEDALVDFVEAGHLLGAGLDVTEEEPIAPTSRLLKTERIVVSPHIAGVARDNFPRVLAHAVENAAKVCAGMPLSERDSVVPNKKVWRASEIGYSVGRE